MNDKAYFDFGTIFDVDLALAYAFVYNYSKLPIFEWSARKDVPDDTHIRKLIRFNTHENPIEAFVDHDRDSYKEDDVNELWSDILGDADFWQVVYDRIMSEPDRFKTNVFELAQMSKKQICIGIEPAIARGEYADKVKKFLIKELGADPSIVVVDSANQALEFNLDCKLWFMRNINNLSRMLDTPFPADINGVNIFVPDLGCNMSTFENKPIVKIEDPRLLTFVLSAGNSLGYYEYRVEPEVL